MLKDMNKMTKFISGCEYSLKQLFGDDTKVIIPDLQRDYCWGDNAFVNQNEKKPRELVSDFIKNIVELYEEDKSLKITLGLIYGYEQPQNHIQICDGQQRLTTLFLLLGYINLKVKGKFNNYIISEKEMNDDYEPHLQYAIRESTLYFLSDLAHRVFVDRTTEIGDIISSNWYFNEYKEDASIQSMIAALSTIDKYFENYQHFDFLGFGDFVLNNLRVLYYDMENRSRGEETYVVINTTGEPLSATENIKPILLGDPRLSLEQVRIYSEQWELREDWFWQNRGNDKTADEGMQDFFLWYWQIGLIQENSWVNEKKLPLNVRDLFLNAPKKITKNANEIKLSPDNYKKFRSLDNLDKYFKALVKLVEIISTDQSIQKVLMSIKKKKDSTSSLDSKDKVWNWLRNADLDIVLPLMVYMAEHGNIQMLYPFTRRLRKNHYDGVWNKKNNEQSRRGKNYMDWRYLVQIINQTKDDNLLNADVGSLKISKIPMVNIPIWYTEDEAYKEKLRDLLPIEEMEDNEFLMGDLRPLWYCNGHEVYSTDEILRRWNILKEMCQVFNPKEADNNIQFANWFRLYRLATGLIGLHHINNCQWSFEGCYYSMKPNEPWWIEDRRIESLLESDSPIDYIKESVKEIITSFINEPNNHQELLVSWMTIKTIQAEKSGYLLNYWNDRAISTFINMKDNYISPIEDFHWGNVFCGYSYSYTIHPARNSEDWKNKKRLDSPITSLEFIPNYYNRATNIISMDTIEKGDEEVKEIIDSFL
jgi:hypothetical protein